MATDGEIAGDPYMFSPPKCPNCGGTAAKVDVVGSEYVCDTSIHVCPVTRFQTRPGMGKTDDSAGISWLYPVASAFGAGAGFSWLATASPSGFWWWSVGALSALAFVHSIGEAFRREMVE